MSMSGSIDFELNSDNSNITVDLFLNIFGQNLWFPILDDEINYLPLGDENFDWKFAKGSELLKIKDVLNEKSKNKELIGITLWWRDTKVGIDVLVYPEFKKISFGLYRNAVQIFRTDVTDFTWYLKRLLPVMFDLGMSIEFIECSWA